MNLKIASAFLVAACFLSMQAKETTPYSTWNLSKIKGEDYSAPDSKIFTHAIPADFPTATHQGPSARFNVAADGHYVALYSDRNDWGGTVSFGMFEFEDGKEVEIEISSREKIESFEVLPKSLAEFTEEPELTNGKTSVRFKIRKADQKFTLVINGDYRGHVVHLFANSIDNDDPKIEVPEGKSYVWDRKKNTYYFKKGYVNLEKAFGNSTFSTSGRNIYIPAGSVVDGQITVGSNSKIHGRGMLMNVTKNIILALSWGNTSTVEGITVYGHGRPGVWTCAIDNFSKATLQNVNIVATHMASVDGFDFNYATDCTIDNCFIRTADDCVAVKALNTKERQGPTKNLTFTRMQLWSDANNAFGLGAETNATIFENIKLLDSEVLFSYTGKDYENLLDYCSAMNICSLYGTYFKNILFENIYVDKCCRLIALGFRSDFWFGQIKGDQSMDGGISGVTFRNISSPNVIDDSSVSNIINLYGWNETGTPDKWVEDITFDNVTIEGKLLANESDSHIVKNEMVRNLKFKNSGVTVATTGNESVKVYPTVIDNGGDINISATDTSCVDWKLYSIDGILADEGEGATVGTGNLAPAIYLIAVEVDGKPVKIEKILIK